VHKSTLSRQVRKGLISNLGTAARPMVDVEQARAERAAALDPAKQDATGLFASRAPMAVEAGYREAKTAGEILKTKRAELDYRREVGELCSRAEVADAGVTLAIELRRAFEARREQLAEDLVPVTDVRIAVALIEASDRALMARLAEDVARAVAELQAAGQSDVAA
jgi:hypothetical protein